MYLAFIVIVLCIVKDTSIGISILKRTKRQRKEEITHTDFLHFQNTECNNRTALSYIYREGRVS